MKSNESDFNLSCDHFSMRCHETIEHFIHVFVSVNILLCNIVMYVEKHAGNHGMLMFSDYVYLHISQSDTNLWK